MSVFPNRLRIVFANNYLQFYIIELLKTSSGSWIEMDSLKQDQLSSLNVRSVTGKSVYNLKFSLSPTVKEYIIMDLITVGS